MTRDEINSLFDGDDWYAKYGVPVLNLILSEPDTRFTLNKIIERTGLSRDVALEALRKLNQIDMIDNRKHDHRGLTLYEASDAALRSVNDRRDRPQQRLCLSCETMFFSTHAGNRMCARCKDDSEFECAGALAA